MQERIQLKLQEIAECIYYKVRNQDRINNLGLFSGEFGILLFMYHYMKYINNPEYANVTESFANRLLTEIGNNIHSHTFCDGFSGILFLFDYFRKEGFVDIDINEVRQPLESYIVSKIRNDIQCKNYDFLHGALGAGYYFLKTKANDGIIIEIIDYLYNTAEMDTDLQTAKWESVINPDVNFKGYNISLSHGMSSIALFLCKAIEQKIEHPNTKELLEKTINYILKQEIDHTKYGSFFPIFSIESSKTLTGSRLSWCYGDLGIAYCLWYAGRTINHSAWENKGLNILLQSTNRRNKSETFVVDAGICHGSSSMVLIYRRMYIETKNKSFMEATNYWLEQTLNLSYFEDGLAGYKTRYADKWINNYSLLTGISGIGLLFCSCLSANEEKWDEMFLL